MTMPARAPASAAFFLGSGPGQRFCLYHPPQPAQQACRGALLYVHPFAEEMNKSRRMAALQARALAAAGFAVLQIDLQGCGDSAGDFGDARWEGWKADLALAHQWLAETTALPVTLWGLRLGALLAFDYAAAPALPVDSLLFWHPVQNGKTFMTQFLRLRMANEMIGENKEAATGTSALRAQLAAGETLEIAGYALAPALAAAIDGLDMARMPAPAIPVRWLEALAAQDRPLPPATVRLADSWRAAGVDLALQGVACPSFWATQEITEAPALLAATLQHLTEAPAHV